MRARLQHSTPSAWRQDSATIALAIILVVVLAAPLIVLGARGVSLTGMTEESVGYRYFHTLRILYGDHERPWLPQGQLVGLTHMALHLALTALSYPPTQLFPRIDLWAYAATGLPLVLTGFAFAWAARPLPGLTSQALMAAFCIMAAFDRSTSLGYHLLQADYYSWVYVVAFVAVGWVVRAVRDEQPLSQSATVLLGIFTGACLAIKPSYLVFSLPIGILLWLQSPGRSQGRMLLLIALGCCIAALTWIGVLGAYYLGDPMATIRYYAQLLAFSESVGPPPPFSTWLSQILRLQQPSFLAAALLVPFCLGISMLSIRRAPAVSLALSTLIQHPS